VLLWRWLPSTRSRARENSGGRSAWYRDPRNHRHPYPSIVDVGEAMRGRLDALPPYRRHQALVPRNPTQPSRPSGGRPPIRSLYSNGHSSSGGM
jgi:hypothetical protein